MSRSRTILAAILAIVAVAFTAGTAAAQDYPPTSPPPSQACTPTPAFSAPALPNATVNVTVGCGGIEAGRSYTGSLASTPVALPTTQATADDVVTFNSVRLPADWATNANHTVTLVDAGTGATLGSAQFFVDRTGRISAPQTGGNIPRTGSDYVAPALSIGAALLAVGTLSVVAARRRRAAGAVA